MGEGSISILAVGDNIGGGTIYMVSSAGTVLPGGGGGGEIYSRVYSPWGTMYVRGTIYPIGYIVQGDNIRGAIYTTTPQHIYNLSSHANYYDGGTVLYINS